VLGQTIVIIIVKMFCYQKYHHFLYCKDRAKLYKK
jgi:hypothetical protein